MEFMSTILRIGRKAVLFERRYGSDDLGTAKGSAPRHRDAPVSTASTQPRELCESRNCEGISTGIVAVSGGESLTCSALPVT